MFIYKSITGKITVDSPIWDIVLRQEPYFGDQRTDVRYTWLLSDLDDNLESRTFLSLKYETVEFISIPEYEQYLQTKSQDEGELNRFLGYLRTAIDYYNNQLTT